MPNPRTFRQNHLKTQGPYVDNCPADPNDPTPHCSTCIEREECVPGDTHYPESPDLPTPYPDCTTCPETTRKACSKQADRLIYGCIYAVEFFALGGLVSLFFKVAPVAIGCGVGLISIAAYGVKAVHHLNRGAQPVQALGCCAIRRKQRS